MAGARSFHVSASHLSEIKDELVTGHHQHRMGESILAVFGYVRRRRTAVDDINRELDTLGLRTDPPISQDMPLRTPRIRFSLAHSESSHQEPNAIAVDETEE